MRPEGRWARGFTEGDDEAYTLTRLRLGVGVEAGRWARFFVEGQDARALGLSHAGPNLLDHVDSTRAIRSSDPETAWCDSVSDVKRCSTVSSG